MVKNRTNQPDWLFYGHSISNFPCIFSSLFRYQTVAFQNYLLWENCVKNIDLIWRSSESWPTRKIGSVNIFICMFFDFLIISKYLKLFLIEPSKLFNINNNDQLYLFLFTPIFFITEHVSKTRIKAQKVELSNHWKSVSFTVTTEEKTRSKTNKPIQTIVKTIKGLLLDPRILRLQHPLLKQSQTGWRKTKQEDQHQSQN